MRKKTKTRLCNRCGKRKLRTEFYKRYGYCKECRAVYMRAYGAEHRRAHAQRSIAYYYANHEARLEYARSYYVANKDEIKARQAQYAKEHADAINLRRRQRYAEKKEAGSVIHA